MQWYDSKGKLIEFNTQGGCYYLVCSVGGKFHNGEEWGTLQDITKNPYSTEKTIEGYIDLVGIKNNAASTSVFAEGNAPVSIKAGEDIRKCVFVRSFTLDPCQQAQKDHNKKKSSDLWTYVNMNEKSKEGFPYYTEEQKHLYVPKASKYNKNIFGTRSTFSENYPNMVNITFGIQATDDGVSGATRCFNWISTGYYDEYVEYKKNDETWEQAKTKKSITEDNYKTEYVGDTNVATFKNIYKRIKWVTTNNTVVTTHKAIIRGLNKGVYNYRIRRTSDPLYMSEVFTFTVRTNTEVQQGFDFVHTTDQQAFNFYEYQAWTKACYAINKNHPNIHFTLNTGDCTQNGNRESEWLDYYNGRELIRNKEEMYVIGNNDLCGVIPYELGDGNAGTYKINHKNIQYYYTFELAENNPAIFKYVESSNLDPTKMGDILDKGDNWFTYYMPSLYSFNYGDYHFIGINSEFADNTYTIYYNDSDKGNIIKQHAYYNMYRWVLADIEKNEGKNYIAFMHELPFCITKGDSNSQAEARTEKNGSKLNHDFSQGVSKTDNTDTNVYTKGCNFSELFQNKGVKLALGGHKHTYSLSYPIEENITTEGNTRTVDYNNPKLNTENGVVYSMCQATGYKLVSNKELPGIGINWLRKYFPMSNGSASSSQYYPMYSLINTAGDQLTLSSYVVHNIFQEKTAFNINEQFNAFSDTNSVIINLNQDTNDVLNNITINYN